MCRPAHKIKACDSVTQNVPDMVEACQEGPAQLCASLLCSCPAVQGQAAQQAQALSGGWLGVSAVSSYVTLEICQE